VPESLADRYVLWSLLGAALLVSVITDLKARRIPDWVTYPTALLALGFRFYRQGLGDLDTGLVSGLASASGAAAFFAFWALRRRIGWGDVKLVFAAGAAFGWPLVLAALAFISLCSFLQGLVTLIWKGEVAKTLGAMLRLKRGKEGEPLYIPFGVAIALGCLWAMWWDRNNP
jgi:prepilin peptidase CpaA